MQEIRGDNEYARSVNHALTPYTSVDSTFLINDLINIHLIVRRVEPLDESNEDQDTEEISAVPMLMLTFPTPEITKSPFFSDDMQRTVFANDYVTLLQEDGDVKPRRRFNSFNGFSVSGDFEIPVNDFGIITSAASVLRHGESVSRRKRRSTGERLWARWSAIQQSTTNRRRKFWPLWRDRSSTVVLPSNSGNTKSFHGQAPDLSASKRYTGSSTRVPSLHATAAANLDVEIARNEGSRLSRRPRVFSFGFGSLRRSIHYVHGAVMGLQTMSGQRP